jgi:hypothetical protein
MFGRAKLSKVAQTEGDIDTSERDRSETMLEDNIALGPLFLKRAVIAAVLDVLQHILDLRVSLPTRSSHSWIDCL